MALESIVAGCLIKKKRNPKKIRFLKISLNTLLAVQMTEYVLIDANTTV